MASTTSGPMRSVRALLQHRARKRRGRERPYKVDLATRILKKEGTPEDIGHIAVYLASEESAYVTGSVFVIDGGSLRG